MVNGTRTDLLYGQSTVRGRRSVYTIPRSPVPKNLQDRPDVDSKNIDKPETRCASYRFIWLVCRRVGGLTGGCNADDLFNTPRTKI